MAQPIWWWLNAFDHKATPFVTIRILVLPPSTPAPAVEAQILPDIDKSYQNMVKKFMGTTKSVSCAATANLITRNSYWWSKSYRYVTNLQDSLLFAELTPEAKTCLVNMVRKCTMIVERLL